MIDFATLQGLTIPEGVVTQIADAAGNVLWAVQSDKPVILEVEKITSDTYVGSTSFTDQQFIMLDIYPKPNGTVTVTYGGLTKTITDTSGAAEPNAQRVYFGTYRGVSDTTPASGTLTIEGEYDTFAVGSFNSAKSTTQKCPCITAVTDLGSITKIPGGAFSGCTKITSIAIPKSVTSIALSAFPNGGKIYFTVDSNNPAYSSENGTLFNKAKTVLILFRAASDHYVVPNTVTSIGAGAFERCTDLTDITLPSGLVSIGDSAFSECTNLVLTSLPSGVTTIGDSAFYYCENVAIADFPNGLISIGTNAFFMGVSGRDSDGYARDIATKMPDAITLPATLGSIGDYAFCYQYKSTYYYSYVSTITILATTPPTVAVLADSAVYKIIVPTGCGEAYKAAEGWSSYADRIVEAS